MVAQNTRSSCMGERVNRRRVLEKDCEDVRERSKQS